MIIGKQGERLGAEFLLRRKRLLLYALADYRSNRYKAARQRLQADKLRDRLLQLVYFKAIHRFSKFKDKKLQAIRTVNQYLHEKRAKRIIMVLRTNLEEIRVKEKNLRKACQFNLFQRPVHLKIRAIAAFKTVLKRKKMAKAHHLRRIFYYFKRGLNL